MAQIIMFLLTQMFGLILLSKAICDMINNKMIKRIVIVTIIVTIINSFLLIPPIKNALDNERIIKMMINNNQIENTL